MSGDQRKAIFLDRDGVLNVDLGYTYKPIDLMLVPKMVDGLKLLAQKDYALVMITNQSGVARGMFTMAHVEEFHRELLRQIRLEIPGFDFDAVMICPHHPEGKVPEFSIDCQCRKPGIQLVTDAQKLLSLDLSKSWLVGDKASDIDCALNAGMRAIQVTRGGKQYTQSKKAVALVPTLLDAANIIISQSL
jgi:D-glycero-D-manno-heptose 1,7-bisphosphate phosphatase